MSLYLCCDCGGTKTAAVICDASGNILGRAIGGPSNFTYITMDTFIGSVESSICEALKTCVNTSSTDPITLPPSKPLFAAAWFGVSGVDSPAAVDAINPVLSKLLGIPMGPNLLVANDTHLLAAPVRVYPDVSNAVTVISGTGSIAVSFKQTESNVIEELGRAGGWGWQLGDEGSGFHVGREAVRQVLEESDKTSLSKNPTVDGPLVRAVLKHFSIKAIMEVFAPVYASDPQSPPSSDVPPHLTMRREQRLSSLAPHVFTCAFEDKDPLALKVLQICTKIFVDKIGILLGDSTEDTPKLVSPKDSVLCFGGSLVHVEGYRRMILDGLAEKGHVFRHVEYVEDPGATGAKGLALSSNV